jgi:uncharacterized protein DUF5818
MARSTKILIAIALVLAFVWPALAQVPGAGPQVPEDALTTRQLIAWSGVQKPQPAPQPLPPRDTPIPQPDQPADQQANPPGDSHHEQTPTQAFTGKIVKDGNKYSLRVGSKTYQLQEQGGLQKYEDQTVRVIGILDLSSNTIQVESIDLIS